MLEYLMKGEQLGAVLQEKNMLCWALPQKLLQPLLGDAAITYTYVAPYSSNYACDEMQKLRYYFSCWQTFVGAVKADAFPGLDGGDHHTASKCKPASLQGAHYITKSQHLCDGGRKEHNKHNHQNQCTLDFSLSPKSTAVHCGVFSAFSAF